MFVVCAQAGEGREDDAVGEGEVADLDGLEKLGDGRGGLRHGEGCAMGRESRWYDSGGYDAVCSKVL